MGTQLSSSIIVCQEYYGDIVRSIPRRAPTLALIAPSMRRGRGPNIAWVPMGDGMVVESYAEGADVSSTGSDSQLAATVAFGRYRANWKVSGTALAVAATSNTPIENIDLWASNYVSAGQKIAETINSEILVGNQSTGIVGLSTAVSNSATYAGQTRTSANPVVSGSFVTANYWSSYMYNAATNPSGANLDGSGKQSLTYSQIRYDQGQIQIACGEVPDLAVMSVTTFNWLAGIFDSQRMYVYDTAATQATYQWGVPVRGRPGSGMQGGRVMLDGGVNRMFFNGTYFYADPLAGIPDGTIYYINSAYLVLECLPAAVALDLFPSEAGAASPVYSITDGFEDIPFDLALQPLAITGDSYSAMLKTYVQIAVKRPNAFGVRYNVTATG